MTLIHTSTLMSNSTATENTPIQASSILFGHYSYQSSSKTVETKSFLFFCLSLSSSGFSGFLLPLQNIPAGGLVTKCELSVFAWCPVIQDVFPPHTEFSWDSLWIHYDPYQDNGTFTVSFCFTPTSHSSVMDQKKTAPLCLHEQQISSQALCIKVIHGDCPISLIAPSAALIRSSLELSLMHAF